MPITVFFGVHCQGCGQVLPVQGAELEGPITIEEATHKFMLEGQQWIVPHSDPNCHAPRVRRAYTPNDLVIYAVRDE